MYEVEFSKDKNWLRFVVKNVETGKTRKFSADLQTERFFGVSQTKPLQVIPSEFRAFGSHYQIASVTYAQKEIIPLWQIITTVCRYNNSIRRISMAEKWINVGITIQNYENDSWLNIPFTKESIKFFKEKNGGVADYETYLLRGVTNEIDSLLEVYPFDSGSRYSDITVIYWYKHNILLNNYYHPEVKGWIYKLLLSGLGYSPNFCNDIQKYLQLYEEIYGKDCSHLSNNIYADMITLNKHRIYSKFLNCDEDLAKRYNPLVIPEFEEKTQYTIITPKTVKEFQSESQQQGNCVLSNYCKRVANGETNIYFIRKKQSPEKSFATMEICNGHITSLLGRGNQRLPIKIEQEIHNIINEHLKQK